MAGLFPAYESIRVIILGEGIVAESEACMDLLAVAVALLFPSTWKVQKRLRRGGLACFYLHSPCRRGVLFWIPNVYVRMMCILKAGFSSHFLGCRLREGFPAQLVIVLSATSVTKNES